MMLRYVLLGMVCFSLLGLEACGFRLKGSQMIAVSLPPVLLKGDASSALMDDLRRAMARSGVIVVTDRGQAELILTVRKESRLRRALSISSAGRVKEYELQYTVLFDVTDVQGNSRLSSQSIMLYRDYSFEATDVLAKNREETFLYKEMRRAAVDSILRRLQVLNSRGSRAQENEIETTIKPEPDTRQNVMPE